ncbi:YccS family putative transporter [Morganella psychrotolerans]|uniref:TIGR01666 family membrane protein n=1 Tax=Morganella psychrotolerans TaxID=368603 RepID=A0A5M9R7R5_9GAMM|nr:YccS family putative transporter [Morganella psychrotolerans]KAA8716601.1 TIGR01666 family membrane protein [Morganella psychrotolerans]OBU09027.1 TIGR01666 family membrane protein [Morganella psychrotolerans]
MLAAFRGFSRYIYNSHFLYYTRIFIALTGTTLVPWLLHMPAKVTIALTLGMVAAALTDLDDRLVGRLRNLFITLISFFVASASIELLFDHHILFMAGLALSTSGFILLGALGQRYATIAFGALLIAIYTMLGKNLFDDWYQQPLLLLAGAVWYNLLTLTGHLLFPIRPLQDNLSRYYLQLSNYLEAKANLFDPDIEEDYQQTVFELAMANSALTTSMNQAKTTLFSRLKGDRGQRGTRHALHYYFVAQDIHERASSSHIQYQNLSNELRYSDIMFRFQRLMSMQGRACAAVAQAILQRKKYEHNPRFERVFSYLENSLNLLEQQKPGNSSVMALRHLLSNLQGVDSQLKGLSAEQTKLPAEKLQEDARLSNENLQGLRDIWSRFRQNLTPRSALFRHAIRMSVLLCAGYAIIQLFDLNRGYWIMLTSLFVCQPNYSATKRRLMLRITGTLAGILIGLPIMYFVPSYEGQLILMVISGLMFFVFRTSQYAQATIFITLLVLFSFNLLGEGFDIALHRIVDTIIGCGLAWFAVSYIWPDWKYRQLPLVIDRTMQANGRYLEQILRQYYDGKNDGLDYRVARRDAHISDGEFASVVANISSEPSSYRTSHDEAFRLLCLNHTLLSYISGLGAHRTKLTDDTVLRLLNDTIRYAEAALQQGRQGELQIHAIAEALAQRLDKCKCENNSAEQLVAEQIRLLLNLIPDIVMLIRQITEKEQNRQQGTKRRNRQKATTDSTEPGHKSP